MPDLQRAIPPVVGLLLFLTTQRWVDDRLVELPVAAALRRVKEAGWRVRAANPRNFVLWRYGRTLTESLLPVLILPSSTVNLAKEERSAIVAFEIAKARSRVADDPAWREGCPDAIWPALDWDSAIDERDCWRYRRLLPESESKILRGVSHT